VWGIGYFWGQQPAKSLATKQGEPGPNYLANAVYGNCFVYNLGSMKETWLIKNLEIFVWVNLAHIYKA